MAITSIKTGSSFTNLVKYNDFLGPNSAYIPSSYESIASVTADGSSQFVYFTSIPSTYKHLQIRGIAKNSSGSGDDNLYLRFNGDTGNNYAWHYLTGNGSSASAGAVAPWGVTAIGKIPAGSGYSSDYAASSIVDIIDYASTSKYKTWRGFNGNDTNDTNGSIWLTSAVWMNTAAINEIQIGCSNTFTNKTTFALYGIKGA